MASLKDKVLAQALGKRREQTHESVPMITKSDEISLTSNDDDVLKQIIENEYARRGVDMSELSIMSTAALVTNGLIHFNERLAEILAIQNRESSILTAQKSVTLYNQLIQCTDNIMLSKPSTMDVFIKINFYDLVRFGKPEGNGKWKFIYSIDNTIQVDGIPFIPQFDIEVLLTKTESKEEIKVQYETSEGYKTIPSQRGLDINGRYYGVFKVPFTQLTIQKEERIFSGEQLDRFIIKTDNPIHDFVLTYKDETLSEPKYIANKLYFTRGSEEYLKYKIHDNKKITINYAYSPTGFNPKQGGKLYITLLTTTGKNVRYRGNAITLKTVPDNLNVEYAPVGDEFVSVGGRLASDNKEYLRRYIIKQKGSRLRIDTETDLRTYLGTYTGKSAFNPKLVISDIIRVFNIYTLMSFENNGNTFTVPTTSGDIALPLNRLQYESIDGRKCYNLLGTKVESLQRLSGTRFYLAPETPTTPGQGETIYNYAIPFHLTYDESNNYVRCLAESQYNVPYSTYCIYDSDSLKVPTRFVNTTLRINDYEDSEETNKRIFSLSTEIRSDNEKFKLTTETFDAEVILTTKDKREVRVPMTKLVDQEKDNKYYLYFDMDSNRKVYDRYFYLTAYVKTNNVWGSEPERVLMDIHQQDAKLDLYTKDTNGNKLLVTTYRTDIDIFKDLSRFMYLQSVVTMDGDLKLLLCPMVEYDFSLPWRNRLMINKELENIFTFIDSEIYDENNEYSSTGYSLKDRQETLFTTSIKFTKTHGMSKFLQLGELTMLSNLQVSPSFKIRLINEQYDINRVSSDTNQFLTKHDFINSDLHMNELVKNVLNYNSENISMLQFVDFGNQYSDVQHMISHNDLTFTNTDVPESVSLKPKWDNDLGVYVYDVSYQNI